MTKPATFNPVLRMLLFNPDIMALYQDLSAFARRFRLKLFFSKSTFVGSHHGQWTPPDGEDACLDAYIQCITTKFLKSKSKPETEFTSCAGILDVIHEIKPITI